MMAYCDPGLLIFTKGKEKDLTVVQQKLATIRPPSENTTMHPASVIKETTVSTPVDISLTKIPAFEIRQKSAEGITKTFQLKSNEIKDLNYSAWVTDARQNATDTLVQCRTISYEHIPRIDYFIPAKTTLVSVNLKTAGSRIGYIEGAGDKIPDLLTAMGYTVIRLNENNTTASELQNLDAVMTGVRAYDVHEWLARKYTTLMDYVSHGGNLIVQYNRNRGTDSTGIGPYPFTISNIRVTEENAPVVFLKSEHRVLHFPNEITEKDFEGWIQERGIYFAQRMDPQYQAVLSMHDSGEPGQNGSLIIADYGKGSFAYTGLVFFRELPAGVPGAYRLLANLIALNKHPEK